MLEVRNLSRSYGDFLAVDQVGFTINKGEVVGLLGHNGAGKTTIMKMLSGFLEPDQGSVLVDGLDLKTHAKTIQRHIGYLPENLPVYPELSVIDYLDYAAAMKGLAGTEREAEVLRAIRATDLAAKALDPINTLSRGYKQRVGVAQALLGKPRLLILDEPTNGLDPTQTEQMRTLIRELAKEATVILSTHIMQEVEAMCDRVLIINAGKLVVDERLERLRRSTRFNLVCDLSEARLRQVLQSVEGVRGIKPDTEPVPTAPWAAYQLEIDSNCDSASLGSRIAECIISQKGKLSRLAPVQRSLESLFREVSAGTPTQVKKEGIRHAA